MRSKTKRILFINQNSEQNSDHILEWGSSRKELWAPIKLAEVHCTTLEYTVLHLKERSRTRLANKDFWICQNRSFLCNLITILLFPSESTRTQRERKRKLSASFHSESIYAYLSTSTSREFLSFSIWHHKHIYFNDVHRSQLQYMI